jgi:hypothetical protein
MRDQKSHERRILAIDPMHRGFGYVVFEGPERLIAWGVRHVQGAKNKGSIRAASDVISLYLPQILVLEDTSSKGCRKRKRVRDLIEALDQLGRSRGLSVRPIAQATVKKTFFSSDVRNKNEMARFIAARFPELKRCVPPERKPWMSEDSRTAIFDAAAFALAFFPPNSRRERTSRRTRLEPYERNF